MQRVLVVKMSSMGDVIHTLPAITDMRSRLPYEVQIDWLVEEAYTFFPNWHPGIANVIPVALRRWRRQLNSRAFSELGAYLAKLRRSSYAYIIDAQGLLKSALLGCAFARGSSHGYDFSSVRSRPASFFYAHRHQVDKAQHAVTRIRKLCAAVLGYDMPQSEPDYGVRAKQPERREVVVLVPHTSQDYKLWQEEKWLELAASFAAEGLEVEVPWGSVLERERAERIAKAGKGKVLERMEFEQLAEVLAGARGMVSLDSGLCHLAAALAVPNVCLCVGTDPALSGALGHNQVSLGAAANLPAAEVGRRFLVLAKATS